MTRRARGVLATAAAVRLLPRRTWAFRAALVSLLAVLVLLVAIGPHALWALGVCVLALAYQGWSARRHDRSVQPQMRIRRWSDRTQMRRSR